METAIILLAKKEEKKTNILPSILFLLLILYLALPLFVSLSPSLFLYHLQRQLFPAK